PGDSLLFIAGFFCSTKAGGNDPHLHLAAVTIGSFVAAVAGAQVGYLIGRQFGTRLFKPGARGFKPEYLARAHGFFEERGAPAMVKRAPVLCRSVMTAGRIRSEIRFITLINGLSAGPAVSLNGSPIVSPITAAR